MDDAISVDDYVRRNGHGERFVDHYLAPLGASLWSCDTRRFRQFPMRFVVEFLHNHRMLQVNGRPEWKTVVGGSNQYVAPLVAPFRDRIRLNTPVTAVRRVPVGVELTLDGGHRERFDEVVLACHADQSRELVVDMDGDEREILGHFPYQVNEAVLHTDTTLLPERKSAWASWNYRVPAREMAVISIICTAIMAVTVFGEGESLRISSYPDFGWLVAYGVLSHTLGGLFIASSLPHVTTAEAGLALLLQPTLSFVWDVLFFNRPMTALELLGAVIALVAIYLGSRPSSKQIQGAR